MRATGWRFGMQNHAPSCKNGPDTDYNQSCSISWNLLILRLKHFTRNVYSCVSLPCWCLLQKQNSEGFFLQFAFHSLKSQLMVFTNLFTSICIQFAIHLFHPSSICQNMFCFLFCVFVCLLSFKCFLLGCRLTSHQAAEGTSCVAAAVQNSRRMTPLKSHHEHFCNDSLRTPMNSANCRQWLKSRKHCACGSTIATAT